MSNTTPTIEIENGLSEKVAAIIAALIVGGGIALLVLYPRTDRTSFYIVVAAMVLSPIFVLAAFLVNKKMQTQ
jgi:hypothetical protein